MGKSYNRNQDKHNKWDRERQQRDSKKNKENNNKNVLTSERVLASRGSFSDESTY